MIGAGKEISLCRKAASASANCWMKGRAKAACARAS